MPAAGEHTVPALAARFSAGPRHLGRLLYDESGTTPARYVDAIRFDTAKAALDGGHSVGEAAGRAGYGNPESLREAFVSRLRPLLRWPRSLNSDRGSAGVAPGDPCGLCTWGFNWCPGPACP
jgi:transcriptional regulator GlxA family with amidase domain